MTLLSTSSQLVIDSVIPDLYLVCFHLTDSHFIIMSLYYHTVL